MTEYNPIQPLTLKAMHRLLSGLNLEQIRDVRIEGDSVKWFHSEFALHDVTATIVDPQAHTVSVTVDDMTPNVLPWSAVLMDSTNEVFDEVQP
jgi:hypothetical protein